jgi:membrane-bound serine protease (ClpP class)
VLRPDMTLIIILAVIGFAFLLAELVLPGGILGVGGFLCLVASVVMTFNEYGPRAGAYAFLGVLLLGFIMLVIWMKNFKRLPFTRQLVLQKEIDDHEEEDRLNRLVGKEGLTETVVAPSGHATIEGEKIDVMTEVGRIEKGQAVRVVEVRGPSIFVEPV